MVLWVVGSNLPGRLFELFHVPTSVPRHVQFFLWNGTYTGGIAPNHVIAWSEFEVQRQIVTE